MIKIKSPLRYPGGKSKFAQDILDRLPPGFDDEWEFREPFVGGGSIFLAVRQAFPDCKIWINDKNPEVFCFWTTVRDDLPKLVDYIRQIKSGLTDGEELYRTLLKSTSIDPVNRATNFFVLNRITFSGTTESGGYSPSAFQSRFTDSSINRLEKLQGLLDGVRITNLDFKVPVVASSESECCLFLDPPYLVAEKSKLYGKKGDLHSGFEHERLANDLAKTKKYWLMTYDNSIEIKELYKDFNREYIDLAYSMSKDKVGKEVLVNNYLY
ncbi:MAG: DNA adenine methylase [Nostoc sp.]|uniref:DNA adenine methylase n=1 Tax=Nostoc sp. TaxID=1180 RepID=UPI002FF365A4